MSSEIGLSQLIQKVKQELLTTYASSGEDDTPLFSIDSVELELQVTVKQEGKGAIKINVLQFGGGELGGGVSRDDVQKIKVQLSPLVNKENLLKVYYQKNPDKWKKFLETSVEALTKGSEDPGI